MRFEGIYTPLIAPFNSDFTLNPVAMASAIDLLVDTGVHGIIVAGTTGCLLYTSPSPRDRG